MEEKIISFVCEALISSEKQINIHDKSYDKNNGGFLGTHVKVIAEKVKKSLVNHEIETKSFCFLMNSLTCIFQQTECEYKISNLLTHFFRNLSFCYESTHGDIGNLRNSQDVNRSLTLKVEIDEIIEIDDDDDDDYENYHDKVSGCEDIFSLTNNWTFLLKQALDKTNLAFKHENNFIFDKTSSHIFYGFFECLDNSLNMAGENSNILTLTDAIESLSKLKNINNAKNNMFNDDGLPNPMIQILATSFRAIIETYKISR